MNMLSTGILGAARAAGMGAPPSGPGGEAPGIMSYLPMIGMLGAIFYLLMFRPQQKKQQEVKELLSSLKKGDQVVTSGGMRGVVAGVRDDIVVLKVADNVKIEFSKTAIAAVTKRESGES